MMSLVCQNLGREDEARQWLARADDWLAREGIELSPDARTSGLHLHDWL